MKKPVLSIDETEQKKAPRADRPPTKGFVVVVDGHFKSEFDTVDAASAAGRKLKSTYPMLQIEIYNAAIEGGPWRETTSRGITGTETGMTLIWLGVLLVFGGMLHLVYQPIWRGRLSGRSRLRPERPSDNTLEPTKPAAGFGIKSNWPGIALVALGAAFLLAGAAI